MTPWRWGVPQCISVPASTPLVCHSLPIQRPMKMQDPHFAWTTLNFLGFISRSKLTPGRIWQPPTQESTALDLASPHLLLSNPTPNPSLDCPLGSKWLVPIERLGEPLEGGLDRVPTAAPRHTPRHGFTNLLLLDNNPGRPQSWIWKRSRRKRTSHHPSWNASHANAVATARRASTGHPSARCHEVAGVTKHPPVINKGDLL